MNCRILYPRHLKNDHDLFFLGINKEDIFNKCFILQLTTVTVQIKLWFVNLVNHVSLCKTIHESLLIPRKNKSG